MITVQTPPCMFCQKTSFVDITEEERDALNSAIHIQKALPNRNAAFRELFISGSHDECWNNMFADDEDEA